MTMWGPESGFGRTGAEGGTGDDSRAARWYRALVQHSTDMVLVVGPDGTAIYASPSTEQLLGYRPDDWNNRDIWEVIHPDDRRLAEHAYQELRSGSPLPVPVAFRIRCADGSYRDVEAVATNRIHDDAVRGIVINLRDISERVRAEREARIVDERYRTLVASLSFGVLLVDADGVVVLVNDVLASMVGLPAEQLQGRPVVEMLEALLQIGGRLVDENGDEMPVESHPISRSLRGEVCTDVVMGLTRGAEVRWLSINSRPVPGEPGGPPAGVAFSSTDITENRRAAADLEAALSQLHVERTFLQVLLDNLEEGIVACDAEGRITMLNPASRRFHGVEDSDDPVGLTPKATGLRHPDGSAMATEENPLLRALAGETVREVELIVENRNGERRVVMANAQPLHDGDAKLGAVVAMHDVSQLKRNEERLADMALHDPLTGVANRILLNDRLRHALDRLRRGGGGVGVFLLDLDDFKAINDLYGHDVGDDVLTAVAGRLRTVLRPQDTVARLGGDEFVVVCEVNAGRDEVQRIAARITDVLSAPYRVGDLALSAQASVGGVLAGEADTDTAKLLSMADDEMYRVKANRRRLRVGDEVADGSGYDAELEADPTW